MKGLKGLAVPKAALSGERKEKDLKLTAGQRMARAVNKGTFKNEGAGKKGKMGGY